MILITSRNTEKLSYSDEKYLISLLFSEKNFNFLILCKQFPLKNFPEYIFWLLSDLANNYFYQTRTTQWENNCSSPILRTGKTLSLSNYPLHFWIRLQLHGAMYRPDSFVLMLRYCANLKAIRYESTSLNRIVADKSHRVIAALDKLSGLATLISISHVINHSIQKVVSLLFC